MNQIQIIKIVDLKEALITHLIKESLCQGFRFMERLVRDYCSGKNCFNKSGEALFAALSQGVIIGIGGLNQDPYFNAPEIGRLRHLYVESTWRRRGVGSLLVNQIIYEACQHYQLLTLRTDTIAANLFYQKLGFKTQPNWEHTTHYLSLNGSEYSPLKVFRTTERNN